MSSVVLVRFTKREFDKVSGMSIGSRFSHINLLHTNTQLSVDSTKLHVGVKILKGGRYGSTVVDPIIDIDNTINLKLLSIDYPFKVSSNNYHPHLLLHNDRGILDSLYDRYHKVMDITKDDISSKEYFVREFEVVK